MTRLPDSNITPPSPDSNLPTNPPTQFTPLTPPLAGNGGVETNGAASPPPDTPSDTEHSLPTAKEEQGLDKIRNEFIALCAISDPLEQNYQLIQFAKGSELPLTEYRTLFEKFKSDHFSRESQKNLLKNLQDEFEKLSRIKNPIERNYCLIHQAQASEVPTEEYRELFEEYERQSAEGLNGIVNNVLHRLASLAGFLGQFTIIVGLILFIAEADSRQKESHTQAWQTITDAKSFTESAGRIQAIQTLKQGCGYRDIQSESVTAADFFHPRGWQAIDWRNVPIIGGFFPDCVSLRGLNVNNAHLPEVDMSWAELNNARMQDTGLWSADLRGAQMEGAQLQRAKLRNAKLWGTNLRGAQLQNADLAGATLGCLPEHGAEVCTDLRLANLTGANLRGDRRDQDTVLYTLLGSQMSLSNAVFTHALYDEGTKVGLCESEQFVNGECQEGSYISVGTFRFARSTMLENYRCPGMPNGMCPDLSGFQRELRMALLTAYEIRKGARLNNAVLRLAELGDADLSQATLTNADLRGVRLQGATLIEANLEDANLGCTELRADKSRTNSTCANLREANLQEVNLTQTNLENAYLAGANLFGANLTGANLAGADLSNTNLNDADLSGANLQDADLRGVSGVMAEQIQRANNWQQAIYDEEMRSQLNLSDS